MKKIITYVMIFMMLILQRIQNLGQRTQSCIQTAL